jgi:hypothetical protein
MKKDKNAKKVCKHPPQRLYAYSVDTPKGTGIRGKGFDLVVGCCECGKVLRGGV